MNIRQGHCLEKAMTFFTLDYALPNYICGDVGEGVWVEWDWEKTESDIANGWFFWYDYNRPRKKKVLIDNSGFIIQIKGSSIAFQPSLLGIPNCKY